MKFFKIQNIALYIILGLLVLITVLVYVFFGKIKKMYEELSSSDTVSTHNVPDRTEIINSINQGIAANKLSINQQEIIDSIKEGIVKQQLTAFEMEFVDTDYFEITRSVHQKNKILGVLIIDSKNEIVYPPVRITNDLTVIVEMADKYSGVIKIY